MFNRRTLRPFDLTEAKKFTNGKESSFCLSVRNATKSSPAELRIDDAIGEDYGGRGITAKDVTGFLSDNKGKPVGVFINSPGGLVFDGLSIYNALISHDGQVTTTITGIAASIASIIVQAGDKRLAYENSNLMCHRAIGVCVGNEADMGRTWMERTHCAGPRRPDPTGSAERTRGGSGRTRSRSRWGGQWSGDGADTRTVRPV